MRTWAVVSFEFEALHHWPDAGMNAPFLRHPHRHIFKVKIWVQQRHDDRDIEFIWFKHCMVNDVGRWKENKKMQSVLDLGHMSCEMIAKRFLKAARKVAGKDRDIRVEVFEDGENGAILDAPASD